MKKTLAKCVAVTGLVLMGLNANANFVDDDSKNACTSDGGTWHTGTAHGLNVGWCCAKGDSASLTVTALNTYGCCTPPGGSEDCGDATTLAN